uniref:Bm12401 n=1 Tax=Brugia malayi TaxID=6279 RepID=A0A1I9GAR9_BRUMA|nr:Bm12401 [Brugia malayi]
MGFLETSYLGWNGPRPLTVCISNGYFSNVLGFCGLRFLATQAVLDQGSFSWSGPPWQGASWDSLCPMTCEGVVLSNRILPSGWGEHWRMDTGGWPQALL